MKLHEVLQNLIINGIKYNDKAEIRIKIAFEDNGSHYRFHVTDNGVGIRPEHQEKSLASSRRFNPRTSVKVPALG